VKFQKIFAGFLFLAYDASVILGLLLAFPVPLSFEAHAEPMTAVVARLAEATKTPLLCAPDVGRRRVIAVIKDAEPEEIRTKLAEAVGAEWVETPKGLKLEITPKRRSAALARHKKLREEWMARAFAQIRVFDSGAWNAAAAKTSLESSGSDFYSYTWTDNPSLRALRRTLHAAGPSLLTEIDWGQTRYFSTLPGGRYLHPLPLAARQAVKTYNAEAETLQQVILANPNLAQKVHPGLQASPGQVVEDRVHIETSDITFSVSRPGYRESLSVAVFMSSPAGTMPLTAFLSLNPDGPLSSGAARLGLGPVRYLRNELSKIEVKPSPEVEKYLAYRTPGAKPPESAPETFRYPERFEPLNLIYGAAARALAAKKGLNVVFQVGDTDYQDRTSKHDASPLGELFASDGQNVSLASKWLVVGPKDQVETDRANLDRTIFGTYCRELISQGHESAMTYLPVARATGGLDGHPLIQMVRQIFRLQRLSSEGAPSAAKLLLFDALSSQSLKGSVRNFNPLQRAALDTYVMGQQGVRFFNLKPVEGVDMMNRLDTLPNVSYPNGLPDDLLVDLKIEDEETAFQLPNRAGMSDYLPLSARFVALLQQPAGSAPPRYQMGRQIRYTLNVEASGNRMFSEQLSMLNADLSKKAVDFAGLPEGFRQRVEAAKKGQG
jgi:hypothetical protein